MGKQRRSFPPRSPGPALLAFALLILATRHAALPEPASVLFESPVDPFFAAAAADAIAAAEIGLEHSRCEAIFTDFHDPSGAPLSANLAARGLSGRGFLRSLRYANGEHLALCRPGVLAATKLGGSVVYLCGQRFAAAHRSNPRLGAALILHEALHALGLSENPPTSLEITAGVLARCGSSTAERNSN
jgi:hypothetical protein